MFFSSILRDKKPIYWSIIIDQIFVIIMSLKFFTHFFFLVLCKMIGDLIRSFRVVLANKMTQKNSFYRHRIGLLQTVAKTQKREESERQTEDDATQKWVARTAVHFWLIFFAFLQIFVALETEIKTKKKENKNKEQTANSKNDCKQTKKNEYRQAIDKRFGGTLSEYLWIDESRVRTTRLLCCFPKNAALKTRFSVAKQTQNCQRFIFLKYFRILFSVSSVLRTVCKFIFLFSCFCFICRLPMRVFLLTKTVNPSECEMLKSASVAAAVGAAALLPAPLPANII